LDDWTTDLTRDQALRLLVALAEEHDAGFEMAFDERRYLVRFSPARDETTMVLTVAGALVPEAPIAFPEQAPRWLATRSGNIHSLA
jgi:hypothetical protein